MIYDLKKKTISSIFWSAVERFSLQGVQFVINIIMARLLLPTDYGMIGMLAVFLQISQTFIDSGFTNALIRSKDRTENDFSTVFYFNFLIAILFYAIIFILAPWIACFYHMPNLKSVTRVIALILIINSLSAVHKTKMTIDVDFKMQSKISVTSAILSGSIGIWGAYKGIGVWALVIQSLLNSTLLTVFFYYTSRWLPRGGFSIFSFKKLFSFGSKLLVSSLINNLYNNLYLLIIGKKFSAFDLGCYTRAEQFAIFPSSNITAVITRVIYPMLSTIQDDNERLSKIYRLYIRCASYLIFPMMLGLAALAKPVILILLTDKWSNIIILLQILCVNWMLDHLSAINLNLLYVKGRSDLALKLEIIKKIIATVILLLSIPFGLVGMCCGRVIYSIIAIVLNSHYTRRLIGLKLLSQLNDIIPNFLASIVMAGSVYCITLLFYDKCIQIILGVIWGIVFYILISFIFKICSFMELLLLLKINNNKLY